ncbi:hypothetical protein [Streptomyces atratus]|uniref:hypothetical protein n=1 Tax=Streptomyces atratus TaxID=1893 RepID=UPI0021A7CE76|nr:hypothetical protein [Streptomyces atratus]MCT2548111.1 hypothetical protein [Streptomyces atratus]
MQPESKVVENSGQGVLEIFDLAVVKCGHPCFAGGKDVGGGVVDEQAAVDRGSDSLGSDSARSVVTAERHCSSGTSPVIAGCKAGGREGGCRDRARWESVDMIEVSGSRSWPVPEHAVDVTEHGVVGAVSRDRDSLGGVRAMADIGSVGGPVTAGCLLPLEGDLDVDVEHPGQDHGREFGGEGEQGGGVVLLGPDADLVQPQTDLAVAEETAWLVRP